MRQIVVGKLGLRSPKAINVTDILAGILEDQLIGRDNDPFVGPASRCRRQFCGAARGKRSGSGIQSIAAVTS